LNAIFYGKGEVCAAGSRLLVEESAHDELVAKVAERASKMVAAIRSIQDASRRDRFKEQNGDGAWLHRARQERGAKVIAGGERADIGTGKGYFIKPTVFDDVEPEIDHRSPGDLRAGAVHDPLQNAEDAVAKGNATVYGLAAASGRETSRKRTGSQGHQSGDGMGQHLQPLRSGSPVRRLQGVGFRPRSRERPLESNTDEVGVVNL